MEVGISVRLVNEDDAANLAELLCTNRSFLAPWEPARADAFFTEEHQRQDLSRALSRHDAGEVVPYVILDHESVVGRVTISDIVRGSFQNGHLGYWVSQAHNGRGVATAAVSVVMRLAFDELGLHRLQAGTFVHNTGSQRVLTRHGFTRIGIAPKYLHIAGRWQDHLLHQRLNEHRD